MGPQYYHMQCYGIKENRSGNHIEQVLGEAERVSKYSTHIAEPESPAVVYGCSVSEVRDLHSEMLEAAKTTVMVKGKERKRAIRSDRKTLMTAIASFPVPTAELDDDKTGQTRARYEQWKKSNIDFMKAQFGDNLKSIIEHSDEEYPHLHGYALPDDDPGCYAFDLHPGEIARKKAAGLVKDDIEGKDVKTATNIAYRNAMRDMQDEYYLKVGAPCGLLRTGPKRKRLTRKQYMEEKAEAAVKARLMDDITHDKAVIDNATKALRLSAHNLDQAEDKNDIVLAENMRISAENARISKENAEIKAELDMQKAKAVDLWARLDNAKQLLKAGLRAIFIDMGRPIPESTSEAFDEFTKAVDEAKPDQGMSNDM